jgi:uncharacterized membrane protein YedE/YeeE
MLNFIDQFLLTDFTMLKMFLSALVTSLVSVAVLQIVLGKSFVVMRDSYLKGHSERGLLAAFIGGSLIGVGMAFSGACPGTVIAQIGAAVSSGFVTGLGGLVGSLIYYHLEPQLNSLFVISRPQRRTLYEVVNADHINVAMITAFVIIVIDAIIHAFFPSDVGFAQMLNWNFLRMKAWPPALAGIGIGLLQLPSILSLSKPIGSSTNLSSCVSFLGCWNITSGLLPAGSTIMKLNYNAIVSFFAMVIGALASAALSGTVAQTSSIDNGLLMFPETKHSGAIQAFVGGVVLYLGARIAGGCTSGHGISGSSFLMLSSFVAVASMFGVAIVTTTIMSLNFLTISSH